MLCEEEIVKRDRREETKRPVRNHALKQVTGGGGGLDCRGTSGKIGRASCRERVAIWGKNIPAKGAIRTEE